MTGLVQVRMTSPVMARLRALAGMGGKGSDERRATSDPRVTSSG